jgi:DNA-binding Lrp family transcriptional regulator
VEEVKARLVQRLREGFYRPGDRFLSNRAVSAKFNISYQTAHRLIAELESDGLLERRAASGSYVPGERTAYAGVQIVFHPRAKRPGSFGERLLKELLARLGAERIAARVSWSERGIALAANEFPIIWESSDALRACVKQQRAALLLNERPPPGLDAVHIDSISEDDFSGGVCAAQLLQRNTHGTSYAVLAGPEDDERSNRRAAGFQSLLRASVYHAQSWFFEDGLRIAGSVVARGKSGIFCCNDRLAEAVIEWCRAHERPRPPIVGFDDAPIAEQLQLTTIAIPWVELVQAAAATVRKRLGGDASTATHQILMPRPVLRSL